jgi:hypothetical protein
MTHQIHGRVQIEVPPEADLVACPNETRESGISDVEAVIEIDRVAPDPESPLEVESGPPDGIELSHEEKAAQRLDRRALFVDPGEDLSAEPQMRTKGASQSKRDGRLIKGIAVPSSAQKVIRFTAGAETQPKPEASPTAVLHLDQSWRRLLRSNPWYGDQSSGKCQQEGRNCHLE